MKKIFTPFCLAAMALMMTLPVVAQERELSNREKAMVVKKVVPAVFDQLKEVSGIDFLAFTKPGFDIEDVVNALPFSQQSALRADNTPLTLQPDSMVLDLSSIDMEGIPPYVSPLLKNLKVKFTDYREFSATIENFPVQISVPGKMSLDLLVPDALILNLSFGEKTGLLPFNALTMNLQINEALEELVAGGMGIVSGELISFEESESGNLYNYNLKIGDALRAILDEEGETPTPDMLVKLDINSMLVNGSVEASLYGIPKGSTTLQVPMGDAVVYLNPAFSVQAMPADSIILTSYENGTVKGYRKLATNLQQKTVQDLVLTTQDSVRASKTAAWKWSQTQIITMTDYTKVAAKQVSVADILSKAVLGLAITGTAAQYSMQMDVIAVDVNGDEIIDDNDKITTMVVDIVPSMGGTAVNPIQAFDMNIWTLPDTNVGEEVALLKAAELGLEQVMNIKAQLPVMSPTIDIQFSPFIDGTAVKMATAYVKSNAMEIIMSNDPVELNDVNIIVQDGGIYIMNCENGTYSVVNLKGTALANGRIDSASQFISLSNMTRGGVYIVTVNQNGVSKSMKFIK